MWSARCRDKAAVVTDAVSAHKRFAATTLLLMLNSCSHAPLRPFDCKNVTCSSGRWSRFREGFSMPVNLRAGKGSDSLQGTNQAVTFKKWQAALTSGYRQLMLTDTVMQNGEGLPSAINCSYSHRRMASRMALLNAGNSGLSSVSRIGHT